MKFYDIENETIKAGDYEIQIKSMGIVGKATPKNKYNVHVPDNDVQIQRNIDISINRMIVNNEAVSDLMVTSCRIGEPQKALSIVITKNIVVAPARKIRKANNEVQDGSDR